MILSTISHRLQEPVAGATVAAVCQDALYTSSLIDTSEACYKACVKLLIAQRETDPTFWLALPAATDKVHTLLLGRHATDLQRNLAVSLDKALRPVMELLVEQAKMASQVTPSATASEPTQESHSLSDTDSVVCGILLVLHIVKLLNHNSNSRDTAGAAAVLLRVLGCFTHHLPTGGRAEQLLTQIPPCINTSLVVGAVRQAMSLLRQIVKRKPYSAHMIFEVLLQMRSLVPPHLDIADVMLEQGEHNLLCTECNKQSLYWNTPQTKAWQSYDTGGTAGGMATLVAGLTTYRSVAHTTARLLHWMCISKQVPLLTRLQSTAMLERMSGLKLLSELLDPEAGKENASESWLY